MNLLALETSSHCRSVALARDGQLLASASWSVGPGARLFQLIDDVLQQAGMGRDAVDTVALGLGPGSYTGIRSTLALAQGWALARPIRLLGVRSTLACAWQVVQEGGRGRWAMVVDAQRGEFYVEEFELTGDGPESVEPLRLAGGADLERLTQRGIHLAGPEFPGLGRAGRAVMPGAIAVAGLAAGMTGTVAPEALEPVYLRPTTFTKAPAARVVV